MGKERDSRLVILRWRIEGLALGSSQYLLEMGRAGRTLNTGSSAAERDGEMSSDHIRRDAGRQNWEPSKTGAGVALKLNEIQEELPICLGIGMLWGTSKC